MPLRLPHETERSGAGADAALGQGSGLCQRQRLRLLLLLSWWGSACADACSGSSCPLGLKSQILGGRAKFFSKT